MVIHNSIFDSYRIEQKEIKEAIGLLKSKGFSVYDKNGKPVLNKF